jgi:organic hydroperoxide reductase OsmC/OhrA
MRHQEATSSIAFRTARVSWIGCPPAGHGQVAVGARAFTQVPLGYAEGDITELGVTNAGELLAAAHASAVTTILGRLLADAGTPARELVTTVGYRFSGSWFEIDGIGITVGGRVPGIEPAAFEEAVRSAVDRCASSLRLMVGSIVSVDAVLHPPAESTQPTKAVAA